MPFEARERPAVIWLRDEPIIGPFCIHCGHPLTTHSDGELLCPRLPCPVLPPSCDCHHIERVKATVLVPAPGVRKTRRRETIERLEIVRNARA